jgi:hypothetical protein
MAGRRKILREGELFIGRRLDVRQFAEQWAEEERKVLEAGYRLNEYDAL